jgi:DNA-binding response OmpR family regulator
MMSLSTVEDKPEVPDEADAPAIPARPEMRTNTVLVVDDEEVIRSVLAFRLSQDDGVEVETAGDARSALAIMEQRTFDAVLTDVKMPGMNGLELLRRIKSRWPEMAVIIMSGHADMGDTIEALRIGAVDFFQKPFELAKVAESLGRIFRGKHLEYTKREALRFLEEESRVFLIPNDLDLCPIITNEVTKNLADKGVTDVSVLESIRVALNEMLFNAIEHGNLSVSYEDKSRMMEEAADYSALIRQRSQEALYANRRVKVEYHLKADEVQFVITDQGEGFEHSELPDPLDPENLLTGHGRGILMTQIYMDEVRYNDRGNQVTLIKRKKPVSPASPNPA